jgi:2-polyprenyl-3-methyl-5-hydroxy-6-metoxy-1,4-benzoquinol methylase
MPNSNIPFCNNDFIEETLNRYLNNNLIEDGLSYATVKDYCDSWDLLNPISKHGDLKNVQRPWALKAILSKVPLGGKILEIGAGEPIIAAILANMGYNVTVVDPYDGTGNGPIEFDQYVKDYPEVRIIQQKFSPEISELAGQENSFHAIYSISVLEHLTGQEINNTFDAIKRYLNPEGYSIHAVDYVHRGKGEEEFRGLINELCRLSNISEIKIDTILNKMDVDTDTYYLSAEAFNAWRENRTYDVYPMKKFTSMQIVGRMSNK